MTLDEFVEEIRTDADRFRKMWIRSQKKHGDEAYPAEMPEGEWCDQFIGFWTLGDPDEEPEPGKPAP